MRSTANWVIVLGGLGAVLTTPGGVWADESATTPEHLHWREPASCGIGSSYMLLKAKGREVSYQEVEAAVGVDADGSGGLAGSSLAAIERGCRQLGVEVTVLNLAPAELSQVQFPAIAHLTGATRRARQTRSAVIGHYVLILNVTDHNVWFIDPSVGYSQQSPRGDFLRAWSGYLIVPEDQIPRPSIGQYLTYAGIGALAATILLMCCLFGRKVVNRARAAKVGSAVTATVALLLMTGCAPTAPSGVEPEATAKVFELTAMKLEHDVVLPENGTPVTATFPIWNSGGVPVKLELGHPTCSCSFAELKLRELAPGQSTELILGMKPPTTAGPKSAGVQVAATGQPWSYTFKINGVEPGLNLPNRQQWVIGGQQKQSLVISGMVYTETESEPVKVTATPLDNGEGRVKVVAIEMGSPRPVRQCQSREIAITLELIPTISYLSETRIITVTITAETRAWTQQRTVDLEMIPRRKSD